jgi:uncharacterized protein YjbI with pentapeptide repeats
MNSNVDPDLNALSTPYRGIEPYRFVDRAIFYARESDTRKLLRYVTIYRGVLLYGNSGAGKSSLINAGLIPALIQENFAPDRIRVQPVAGEEFIVERVDGIASNFLHPKRGGAHAFSAAQFGEKLKSVRADRYPLLIFDQFEELITLFEEAPRGKAAKAANARQKAILHLVVDLLRDPELPVKLLFSFREDYLAKLTKLFVLSPDLQNQYLRLTPPKTDLLHDIIRGPFERPELKEHFGKELSEKLANSLIPKILERTEGDVVNLTEVQIICSQLWQSQRPEQLFRKRGIQGLLEDYTTNAIDKLAADHLKWPAIALLGLLVTPSGTRNIVSKDDLIERAHEDDRVERDKLERALHALETKSKLIVREQRHGTSFFEIVSEFLVPWILQQKTERQSLIWRRSESFRASNLSTEAVGPDLRQLEIIREGVGKWNLWRDLNPGIRPRLHGSDLSGMELDGVNLSEAALTNANLKRTSLRSAALRGADFSNADLSFADLTKSDLSDANLKMAWLKNAFLKGVDLHRADLTLANLENASLNSADLSFTRLAQTNLKNADLANCIVYGIAAWDLDLAGARQSNLTITPPDEPAITVNNLEVAQYSYLFQNPTKVREMLDTLKSKTVLVLGRFVGERRAIFDLIRDELQEHGYLPVVFDFVGPATRNFTEAVSTLAGMSRFIIADVTGAPDVRRVMETLVTSSRSVPVQPLIQGSALLDIPQDQQWVLPVLRYRGAKDLARSFRKAVIAPAERRTQIAKSG